MSHRIYTPEFKDEAVGQVVDRGYTVKEVAERLGISEASLYTWRKAVVPSKGDEREVELLEVKRENLTLRAELRRTQEERDILKKAALYSTDRRNALP
jgi:transposase